MLRKAVLPLLMLLYAAISLTTLRSVAPDLVPNQTVFLGLGLIIFGLTAKLGYHFWAKYVELGYLGLVGGLILTLVTGTITRGSTRWISVFGLFNIQPSQLAVPIILMFVAKHFLDHDRDLTWQDLFKIGLTLAIPALLIFVEPDLSTTMLLVVSLGVSVLMGKVQWHQVALGASIAVAAVAIGWIFILQPYQKQRVISFATADQNPEANYHAQQSMIAVGSGQIWGRGLGQGVQSHLRFLPERQTDFIFASMAEELGLVGSWLVIGAYLTQLLFFLYMAHRATHRQHQHYIYGLTTLVAFQTFINIGMNLGLLPITGVTLPLISYGGSSVLSMSFAYGLVQASILTQKKELVRHFE